MAEKKWSELIKQYHTGKMADKTQNKDRINAENDRIFIFGFKDNPCDSCEAGEVGYCENNCYESIMFDHSISKKDAIKAIAFALMQSGLDERDCVDCAEVSLNAILGIIER